MFRESAAVFGRVLLRRPTTRLCRSIRQVQPRCVASIADRYLEFHDLIGFVLPIGACPLWKELKARHGFEVSPWHNIVLEFFRRRRLLVGHDEARELLNRMFGFSLVGYHNDLEKVRRNRHQRRRSAQSKVLVFEFSVSHLAPRQPKGASHNIDGSIRSRVLGVDEPPDPFLQTAPYPFVHDGILWRNVGQRVRLVGGIPVEIRSGSHVAPIKARLVIVGEL
mmetsp:Transcript_20594/g.42404  ORF Transcript_20594/g.42404 Transcript_20594/m.42404 type:complete len:222 (-) Transcript_20594:249-914(-)